MGELEQERSRRHREGLHDILKTSSTIMARAGFHGTSMRELARETGRSLAGLYHYFENKEELLFLINVHGFNTLNEMWQASAGAFRTPAEKLYAFIYLHTHYYVANLDEMRVMNWGTQALEFDRAMTIKALKDRHTADAADVVSEVYRAASGKALSDQQLTRKTYLLFGMMNWIFGWYDERSHGTVDELVRDIYRTFMFGVEGTVADNATLDHMAGDIAAFFRRNGSLSLWDNTSTATHGGGHLS